MLCSSDTMLWLHEENSCLCHSLTFPYHIPGMQRLPAQQAGCTQKQILLPSQARMQPQASSKPPQPVDFWVPPGVSVVTLTGPNTGGKTASLKALGLAATMSKAGLFLPLQSPEGHLRSNASAASLSLHSVCKLDQASA